MNTTLSPQQILSEATVSEIQGMGFTVNTNTLLIGLVHPAVLMPITLIESPLARLEIAQILSVPV